VSLNPAVRSAVERALAGDGVDAVRITNVRPVGGGCISPTVRALLADGRSVFIKFGAPRAGMFPAESEGLRALATRAVVRVPAVLAVSAEWLVLEWLEPGVADAAAWEAFGRGLAELHRPRAGNPAFGWERDNFIGPLPQANLPTSDWAGFWRERRLLPQLREARDRGHLSAAHTAGIERVLSELPQLVGAAAATDGAALLHGDLWSGNVLACAHGGIALVDPAVYRGHREVDLAMAELFGGFHERFHAAYREAWPLSDGYVPVRRAVYQLYYLLVHVNLFGASYVAQTLRAASEALGGR
jgi:protein-ribulosamine 3-kinase